MDKRTTFEPASSSRRDTAPAAPTPETRPRPFSEMAKKTMLTLLEEMNTRVVADGYLQAWASFQSMAQLHDQLKSGLIDDPDVRNQVRALSDKIHSEPSTDRSREQLDFIEDLFLIDPEAQA